MLYSALSKGVMKYDTATSIWCHLFPFHCISGQPDVT